MTSGQALSCLGATSYTFNVAQNITSVLLEPVQAANLWWPMVATATDRNGNTSELSDPFCPGAYPDVDRSGSVDIVDIMPVSSTHLRAHETVLDLVCRLLLEQNSVRLI